ncbi:glycosylphosphatidylinositol-anchored lipid protein transfer 13 [Hibiscus trionum]|uniref:Glycosylphosphatidylinositol-anchored lipid protein transfer 13 n=1 Tax=Hibiscus trionum TaxID=183268 RepID=A0A9W7I5V1_HIBTR|nr:glycosylphosphatidylinositol-anchored lipid protein transfer 13 [Hibiscus trionum]
MGSLKMVVVCFVVASWAIMSTMGDDEKECADQLANLASCIPFVSGTAKKPAPECCQDTQKLKATKPKCLCLLIKQSTDPSLGLPVNSTLALQMPSACSIDAKVSDCPSILNLSPDSPDAKIFKEADQGSTTTSTSSPPATESAPSSSVSKATPSSNSGNKVKVFLGGNCLVLMALVAWIFM